MDQEQIERTFSRKHAHDYVYDMLLEDPETIMAIHNGVNLVEAWMNVPAEYKSKQERKDSLAGMNIGQVVQSIFCTVIQNKELTLANLAGQIGASLGFADTRQGITLAGELIGILCYTDLYDIGAPNGYSQYYVTSRIILDDESQRKVDACMYMPPMIIKPCALRNNRSSGYITLQGQSLILGGAINHHDADICLSVLNTANSVPLAINEQFIHECKEEPSKDLYEFEDGDIRTPAQRNEVIHQRLKNWQNHKVLAEELYQFMIRHGNRVYMTNKVDKRGRIYAQGHHINPMGSSYKKAMLDLANKETVEIPDNFWK